MLSKNFLLKEEAEKRNDLVSFESPHIKLNNLNASWKKGVTIN